METEVQKTKLKALVGWLETNHMIITRHDYAVDRNGNGWEQVHREDCRLCEWERIKEEILNG